ncbi:succinate dehydrogenase, hydrophobic membrane anchor protein [Oleiagrimonas sp.]|jgi:succinate dehydrogenase / fumarate reductase membrane anchor subunit|uniref:succinate dehydrogenase, hydrophobic membrane anchor protein n=1 Tax=Oleiagrimonas sp. TaxID=2010330 RepID=UPI002636D21B|nr:succinate dehydrogenase, hydrophobic membrane anchor protein [Oleiagrimonas sp.]MDA3913304.1 succinate dehydrogenase, hydrophobic membrane anchor protein [Oleiagrimonas sp.]
MSRFRNPARRAIGLGSAKSGAQHWWMQRMTAVALIALCIWFVVMLLSMLHADYASAHAVLARPWNAALMIAFTSAMFWHAQLGLAVVIEDYVHTRWLEFSLIVLVKLFAVLFAIACALAVLRIALAG